MGVTEDLADELARDVIKAIEATGDETIIIDIQNILGATSQTAEEAFLTAVRVRRANIKARALLLDKLKRFKAAQEAAADKGDG
ncbi:NH3-dependent NAD+ synthetase [Roseovarius sp. MBR-51]